ARVRWPEDAGTRAQGRGRVLGHRRRIRGDRMESKGRRKRPSDQLQGSAVQDQAIRAESQDGIHASGLNGAAGVAPDSSPIASGEAAELDMLVIQYGDRTIKGYSPRSHWPAEDPNFHTPPAQFQPLGSAVMEAVPLGGVKAIFFVKSFEGKSHDDLRFH